MVRPMENTYYRESLHFTGHSTNVTDWIPVDSRALNIFQRITAPTYISVNLSPGYYINSRDNRIYKAVDIQSFRNQEMKSIMVIGLVIMTFAVLLYSMNNFRNAESK